MKILIRTDAGVQIGNGHIIRMLALADQLGSRKIDFAFALKQDDFWLAQLRGRGYHTIQLSDDERELLNLVQNEKVTHLIYDTRNDLTVEQLSSLKEKTKVKLIVIDSPEDTRLVADVNIYPPIPQVKEWSWDNFKGQNFSGWEYVLLRKEIALTGAGQKKNKQILLSFGSTDPFLLTEWALGEIILNHDLFEEFELVLVVGPQFNRLDAVKKLPGLEKLNITILQGPGSIEKIFQSVHFAFIALGVTAYELAALSVPFLFVSISEDHAKSGEVFESNGLGYSLGIINKSLDNFGEKVGRFMNKKETVEGNLKNFGTHHKICDWPRIVNAIIN